MKHLKIAAAIMASLILFAVMLNFVFGFDIRKKFKTMWEGKKETSTEVNERVLVRKFPKPVQDHLDEQQAPNTLVNIALTGGSTDKRRKFY